MSKKKKHKKIRQSQQPHTVNNGEIITVPQLYKKTISEKIKSIRNKIILRVKWRIIFALVFFSFLTAYLLSNDYFRENIAITNPITATSTSIVPENVIISDNILAFPNSYNWQTILPSLIPFKFLNYSDFCFSNHNQSYFQGKKITNSEISPEHRGDNGKIRIGIAYKDGRYFKFEIPNGNSNCLQVETQQLIGGSQKVEVISLVGENGEQVSEIRTENSVMYLWPGYKNEIFLAFIMFLIYSAIALYVDGMRMLILK